MLLTFLNGHPPNFRVVGKKWTAQEFESHGLECAIEGTDEPASGQENRQTRDLRRFPLFKKKSETTFDYQLLELFHECGVKYLVQRGVHHVPRQKA